MSNNTVSKREDCGLFWKHSGPLAVIRQCKYCAFTATVRVGLRNPVHGRGYGMSVGNKARGSMIQHAKAAHPAEYEAHMNKKKR